MTIRLVFANPVTIQKHKLSCTICISSYVGTFQDPYVPLIYSSIKSDDSELQDQEEEGFILR